MTSIYGFQIHSPGGKRLYIGDWDEVKAKGEEVRLGIATDKGKLLEGVLKEAEKFHVETFSNTNVTGIKKKADSVIVETDRDNFESTFVIAADGVNSRIARLLGFNKERSFHGTWRSVCWEMKGEIPVDTGCFNFILTEKSTFSLVPTCEKNMFHLSTFTYSPEVDLNSMLEDFVNNDKTYAAWFKNTERVGTINCVVNENSPIQDPFKDNVLLIGDSAWMKEISNMASFCSGWKAGNTVTQALLEKKYNREGLAAYFKWWEENFYTPHGKVEFASVELQKFLSGEEIDYLAALPDKPIKGTMNFYKLFSSIGQTYAELLPRLQDERPEIMEKLMEMRVKSQEGKEKQVKMGYQNK
jgi:flavin-dependent dehydrogenase